MFVKMSGALLPSFSLFCPAIAQPLAEMLMQLVPMDVIPQGERRPLLHHCPGIAIRLTPSKPRKRSPGGDDCSRNRPVRPSEVETTSRMKRTSATFDERSWTPSAAPMSMGPKADSADLQPVASEKSPIRPDYSHWLAGGYSQKLGGKFAQGFCDATVKNLSAAWPRGVFRGYPLVTILLAAVKAWPTLDRVAQTGAEWDRQTRKLNNASPAGAAGRVAGGEWQMADGGWRRPNGGCRADGELGVSLGG